MRSAADATFVAVSSHVSVNASALRKAFSSGSSRRKFSSALLIWNVQSSYTYSLSCILNSKYKNMETSLLMLNDSLTTYSNLFRLDSGLPA